MPSNNSQANYPLNHRLESLIDLQSSYSLKNAALHVLEAPQPTDSVLLRFDKPVLICMLQGRTVVLLNEMMEFEFLPGESLLLPSNEAMRIDFAGASMHKPPRCLTLTIAEEKIQETVQFLHARQTNVDSQSHFINDNPHFTNDPSIYRILNRLLYIFTENHPSKDIFADLMLHELIIRILQTERCDIYSQETISLSSNHRLAFIIEYIRKNIHKELTVKELSNKIHMSESNFHRVFKKELNISPIDFINNERIKLATSLLQNPRKKIKEVYTECGFNSLSYFIRVFKRKHKRSPREYQQSINNFV